MECKECFFVTAIPRNLDLGSYEGHAERSADQSNLGVDVSIYVELNAISGRNPPQAFLKGIAGVLFQESYYTSSVKRQCCATLTLQVYSLRLLIVVHP